MSLVWYTGTDWQQSSGPQINRKYDASADLWPHGLNSESDGAGDKDVLTGGGHPILAIGAVANTPNNLTGVVVSYNEDADLAIVNVASKHITRQYVANILTYSGGDANSWAATWIIGQPVYVDYSNDLSAGVSLSLSPLNDQGTGNPLAGYIMYCQDQYYDSGVGGAGTSATFPITADNSELVEAVLCVMHVNDSGQARALIAE